MSEKVENLNLKFDLILDELMGLEITDNEIEYGFVCRVDQVITTLGKTFSANLILHALREVRMNQYVIDNENRDDNVKVLPVGYPDGTSKDNGVVRVKRKSVPFVTQAINNNAKVGDGESINITSHVSSGDCFPSTEPIIEDTPVSDDIDFANVQRRAQALYKNIESFKTFLERKAK
jgi:hypothetical protein